MKAAPAEETKAEELEDFKYDIESEKGWVGPGGSAKEATVKQLPVSQTIAGVSMKLDPGRYSRIALARFGRRMGLCAHGTLPHYRDYAEWPGRGG